MKTKAGYTLIEVLVGGVVLGLTLVAVVSMIRVGVDLDQNSDLKRQATDILSIAMQASERYPGDVVGWNGLASDYEILSLRQGATQTIPCTLSVDLGTGVRVVNGQNVPYKSLAYRVGWASGSIVDTVLLVKLTYN